MSTNCTLYRSNRITPIYTLLQSTCFVLGDTFAREVDNYWEDSEFDDLQFAQEIERFGRFLRRRIETNDLTNPLLAEVLEFELAWNALRFVPRRKILRELDSLPEDGIERRLRLHPLLRIVRFRHDPLELLKRLAEQRPLPYDLREGEFFLLVNAMYENLQTTLIDRHLGQLLMAIDAGFGYQLKETDIAHVTRCGLVVR